MSIRERRRSSVTREVITANAPLLKSEMNLKKVAEAVSQMKGMLTTDQENLLWQWFTPEEERKSLLLEFVCQNGDEKREQFLECLRSSGHEDLATQIKRDIDRLIAEE